MEIVKFRAMTFIVALMLILIIGLSVYTQNKASPQLSSMLRSAVPPTKPVDSLFLAARLLLRTHDMTVHNDASMITALRHVAINFDDAILGGDEILTYFSSLQLTIMERECQGLTFSCWDGISFFRQQQDYLRIARGFAKNHTSDIKPDRELVYCETGFNSGMSALPFLLSGYKVFSFDLMKNRYSPSCSLNLEILFPEKFSSIKGSSRVTMERFRQNSPHILCDVMSVDGGHSKVHVLNDIKEFREMSQPKNLILIDDVFPMDTSGVYQGLLAAVDKGYVRTPDTCYDGEKVNTNRGLRHKGYCVARLVHI